MDRDRDRAVMFQEFFNSHVLLMEVLFYHWKCLWHIDIMTSYDVIWFDNAVKLWKTTISQHKDRIERQIERCLLCIYMLEIHWSHFQFQQYCIFQDGGQYGRQIIQKEISQHTDMIEWRIKCRLLCIHGPEIHWSYFQFQQYRIFQDGGQYGC